MKIRQLLISYQPIPGTLAPRHAILSAGDAASYVRPLLQYETVEVFLVILLDTKLQVISVYTVSRGDLSSTIVHPREVFTAACLVKAASIITAHNHPSGIVDPSREDVAVWGRLNAAGEIMGIPVSDHLIIGSPTGEYYSAMEHGSMKDWKRSETEKEAIV